VDRGGDDELPCSLFSALRTNRSSRRRREELLLVRSTPLRTSSDTKKRYRSNLELVSGKSGFAVGEKLGTPRGSRSGPIRFLALTVTNRSLLTQQLAVFLHKQELLFFADAVDLVYPRTVGGPFRKSPLLRPGRRPTFRAGTRRRWSDIDDEHCDVGNPLGPCRMRRPFMRLPVILGRWTPAYRGIRLGFARGSGFPRRVRASFVVVARDREPLNVSALRTCSCRRLAEPTSAKKIVCAGLRLRALALGARTFMGRRLLPQIPRV